MRPTELGKTYLMVFCKSCRRGIRVIEEPLFEGRAFEVREAKTLKCHRCGHEALYQKGDMCFSKVLRKPREHA